MTVAIGWLSEASESGGRDDAHVVFPLIAPYSQTTMKLPDLYTDWRVMGGLALVVLGAGNWTVGLQRTEQYGQMIAAARDQVSAEESYRNFDELDAESDAGVLEPLTDEERKVSYASARMDFYHATFLTGQILVVAGLLLTSLGFVGVIRKDARRALAPPGDARDAPVPE